MKSNKQRRTELKAKRALRATKQAAKVVVRAGQPAIGAVTVTIALLAPNNSYGTPDFVVRGHYVDRPFRCADCGREQMWTATQQKWWYEVAKGDVFSVAKHCRACRRKKRILQQWQQELQGALAALDPQSALQLANVGELYEKLGHGEQAIEYFRRARNRTSTQEEKDQWQEQINRLLGEKVGNGEQA